MNNTIETETNETKKIENNFKSSRQADGVSEKQDGSNYYILCEYVQLQINHHTIFNEPQLFSSIFSRKIITVFNLYRL